MRGHRRLGLAVTLVALLAASPAATAQPAGETAREQAFVETLRREDPAVADRYVALRDARAQAIAELRKVETQYNAAGPELRGLFARPLLQARRKYAETSLALLDFYDARDREALTRYREEIGKIDAAVEARRKTRAELEKLLAP